MILFVAVMTPIYYLVNDNKIPLMISSIPEKISFNQNDSILDKTVKIKTNNQIVNEILAECGNEQHCIVKAFQKLAQSESPKIIMATVNDLLSSYQERGLNCHQQAHHIGEFLYGYFGDLSQVLSYVDRRCGGALYHGILGEYLESNVLLNDLTLKDIEISKICSEFEDPSYGILQECAHGLGHGLAKAYDYDFVSAVKKCDQLEAGVRTNCYYGVSMENVDEYTRTEGGDFDENDILYPCNNLEEKYASGCYYHHAYYIVMQKNFSVFESFDVCDKIESENSKNSCYSGIFRTFIPSSYGNMNNMVSMCQKAPQDYQKDCIQVMVDYLLDQKSADKALEFCKIVPEKFKMNCYDVLGNGVKIFYPKDVANVCSNAEENYYDVCMNGIPQKFNCSITYELDGKSITEFQECLLV